MKKQAAAIERHKTQGDELHSSRTEILCTEDTQMVSDVPKKISQKKENTS